MAYEYKYIVRIAPGCHGGSQSYYRGNSPYGPAISRHRSWEAALHAASRSDRRVAEHPDGRTAQIPAQGSREFGAGRLGGGLTGRARTAWVRANLRDSKV